MPGRVNVRWASKVLKAKSFIVLTEKESVVALRGIEPEKFTDKLALYEQSAAIADFLEKLTVLKKRHDRAMQEFGLASGITSGGKSGKVPVKTRKKAKKISVEKR